MSVIRPWRRRPLGLIIINGLLIADTAVESYYLKYIKSFPPARNAPLSWSLPTKTDGVRPPQMNYLLALPTPSLQKCTSAKAGKGLWYLVLQRGEVDLS